LVLDTLTLFWPVARPKTANTLWAWTLGETLFLLKRFFVTICLAVLWAFQASAQWLSATILEPRDYQTRIPIGATQAVSGTFTVPAPACTAEYSVVNIWAGIGGFWAWDQTLQQVGVEIRCLNGQPDIRAWWEFFPFQPYYWKLRVLPGDVVTVKAEFDSAQACTLTFVNETTGIVGTAAHRVGKARRGSAEFVVEAEEGTPAPEIGPIVWISREATIRGVHGSSETFENIRW